MYISSGKSIETFLITEKKTSDDMQYINIPYPLIESYNMFLSALIKMTDQIKKLIEKK